MAELDKYVKIVLLSTLAEQNTLADISITWFKNKGRLYQPIIIREIRKAVNSGLLGQQDKRFYRADISKFIELIINLVKLGDDSKIAKKYESEVKYFYLKLGNYTQKVYLNFEVIKVLTKLNLKKTEEFDPALLIQLPFILRYLEDKDPYFVNTLIQLMGLEEYVKLIYKLERRYMYILEEEKMVDWWVESFERIIKLLPKLQKKGLPLFQQNTEKIKAFGK